VQGRRARWSEGKEGEKTHPGDRIQTIKALTARRKKGGGKGKEKSQKEKIERLLYLSHFQFYNTLLLKEMP